MNIADYFKAKPDKPVDALIKQLLNDETSVLLENPAGKTETDALVDNILNKREADETQLV